MIYIKTTHVYTHFNHNCLKVQVWYPLNSLDIHACIPGWTGLLITILIPPTVVAATRRMYGRLLESRRGMFENVTEPDEPVCESGLYTYNPSGHEPVQNALNCQVKF